MIRQEIKQPCLEDASDHVVLTNYMHGEQPAITIWLNRPTVIVVLPGALLEHIIALTPEDALPDLLVSTLVLGTRLMTSQQRTEFNARLHSLTHPGPGI